MKRGPDNAVKIGSLHLCLLASVGCLRVAADEVDLSKLPPPATNHIDFARDIKPILEANCLRCHGPEKPRSKFRLDTRASALKGGEEGVDILPGDSAHSTLIHYTAYLVEDSEMPPIGKGNQLTAQQVSVLRAWIDQGAAWEKAVLTNTLTFSVSPMVGDTKVIGDQAKYREQYWQKDGPNGGVDQFELSEQTGPDTRWLLTGHALVDDYLIGLSVDRTDLGFIHSGWQQYRKYYDDTGGYDPALMPNAPRSGEDVHLDIGKAWVDVGLTLPDWPRLVLGYEYDYRQGNQATTEWNAISNNQGTTRNIGPNSQSVGEGVHIIKFDLNEEIKGVTVEDRFRGEFYHLSTGSTNVASGGFLQKINEDASYFQGANTLRLEKKFNDWFFGSAGYLYSKLNADSAFNLDEPTLLQITSLPHVTLEQESHVGNVNGLLGPFNGLVISSGVQAEWTRQHGLGTGTFDQESSPPGMDFLIPFNVASDYDQTSLQENLSLQYSKIPFTGLFADGHFEQENIAQYDQFSSSEDILDKAVFLQHTEFSGQTSDLRAGFDTSPWRAVFFSTQYRHEDDASQYDSAPLIQPIQTAYPTFIHSRDLITDEVEAKLVLHPVTQFKTTLTYRYESADYDVDTGPYNLFGSVISPGGELSAGNDRSQTFSISATYTPTARLFLSTTASYQLSTLQTFANGSAAVVPYQGDIYTVFADGTYVLSQFTDLSAGYIFSEAGYGQNNYAAGLPLGIEYQRHSAQIRWLRRLGKNLSTQLQYRFDYYAQPSNGGASNYRAHSIFGLLTYHF